MPVLIFVVVCLVVLAARFAFTVYILKRAASVNDRMDAMYERLKETQLDRQPDPTPPPPPPTRP